MARPMVAATLSTPSIRGSAWTIRGDPGRLRVRRARIRIDVDEHAGVLEVRHDLGIARVQDGEQRHDGNHRHGRTAEHGATGADDLRQRVVVGLAQTGHQRRHPAALGQQVRQRRRDRQRDHECNADGERVRDRHRGQEGAGTALHDGQRHDRQQGDRRRVAERSADLLRRLLDDRRRRGLTGTPLAQARAMFSAPTIASSMMMTRPRARPTNEIALNVLPTASSASAAATIEIGTEISVGRDGASDAICFISAGVPAVEFGPIGGGHHGPAGMGVRRLAGDLSPHARRLRAPDPRPDERRQAAPAHCLRNLSSGRW